MEIGIAYLGSPADVRRDGSTQHAGARAGLTRYEGIVDRVMLGGLDVGATRAEVVRNTRGLIAVADAWTRKQGLSRDG